MWLHCRVEAVSTVITIIIILRRAEFIGLGLRSRSVSNRFEFRRSATGTSIAEVEVLDLGCLLCVRQVSKLRMNKEKAEEMKHQARHAEVVCLHADSLACLYSPTQHD